MAKKGKKKIYQLEQEEGTIFGDEDLKVYISEFYKKLFGDPIPSYVDLIEDNNQDIPKLSIEENNLLTSPFNEKGVHEAISQMEHNKAPGPDGFPVEFYQIF
jgi:hypothetical protein